MAHMSDPFARLDDVIEIETRHLFLTGWRREDAEAWAAINADEKAREFIGETISAERAAREVAMFQADLVERGFGLWAARLKYSLRDRGEILLKAGDLVGFVGATPAPQPDGKPAVYEGQEIEWQLAWCLDRRVWGMGLATEAASKVRDYLLGVERLDVIGGFAASANGASLRVMEKIGLKDTGIHYADASVAGGGDDDAVVRALTREKWRKMLEV